MTKLTDIFLGLFIIVGTFLFCVSSSSQTLKNLSAITKETKKRKVLHLLTLYENIYERFILPDSFLLMKNRGEDLCSFKGKIEYVDYEIKDLFY